MSVGAFEIIGIVLIWLLCSALLILWSVNVYRKGYFRGWSDSADHVLDRLHPENREAYPEMFEEE